MNNRLRPVGPARRRLGLPPIISVGITLILASFIFAATWAVIR